MSGTLGAFSRRGLLGRALALLGVSPLPWSACASSGASVATAPASATSPVGRAGLSTAELEDLVAFGELVVEGGVVPPDARGHLSAYIEQRARRGDRYLTLYRATAQTLERLAGRRFSTLDVSERRALISRHALVTPRGEHGEAASDADEIRSRAVPDLILGYYASPAGWAVVGYDTFPGRCGTLTRYTGPER